MNCDIDLKNAVECLRQGGVILYPTDTIWGIGCDATNEEAVKRVYEIKKREDNKALICLRKLGDTCYSRGIQSPVVLQIPESYSEHQCQY